MERNLLRQEADSPLVYTSILFLGQADDSVKVKKTQLGTICSVAQNCTI